MKSISAHKGWYYIRKNRKPNSWSLYYQWFEGEQQVCERVEPIAYPEIGIKADLTTEQAKARVKLLNKERAVGKNAVRKAARNLVEIDSVDKLMFPPKRVQGFYNYLVEETSGSAEHTKKLHSHFRFVQKMLKKLQVFPKDFRLRSNAIYKYLASKKASVDYSHKIINSLNHWGRYNAYLDGHYYVEVRAPKGRIRSEIADSQKTKKGKNSEMGVRTASEPLTPTMLLHAKNKFTNLHHYNWLYLSLWLGLRPSEVDSLLDKRTKISRDRDSGVTVLTVYQSKIMGLEEDKRYKHIPILFVQQHQCLEILKSKQFKRPHPKTVRRHIDDGITLYGGRKGFTDLMLDMGQKIENISIWLGHTSIETTWKHYKDRKQIRFTETPEIKKAG